ncbi:hypothetical protein P886_1676 [Alteromonadaceae bacterium 2753L.S.0a.02]|nr:hypothetical protein P886_1676 [Alteromonadaceae bacterium 2753L.S.0a.02]
MSVLDTMPSDGRAAGHIIVGDGRTNGDPCLTWGTQYPAVAMPAGHISVRCFSKDFNTFIVSQYSDAPKGLGVTSHNIYWLPWGNGSVASVDWLTLSSTTRFLTSTFTGCRFVVNQNGVAHVSWGGHSPNYNVRGNLSSVGRDLAEVRAGTGVPDMGRPRRTLSITGAVPGRPNEQRISYDVNTESCVVMGWRAGNRWTFKCLKMNNNNKMKSSWNTLAQVDVNAGVATII